VSVHGISIGESTVGAAAVGDTFLFSVSKKLITLHSNVISQVTQLPLLSDSFCLTHAVPYYRSLLGVEEEDRSAQRFLSSIQSPNMLQALGLGDPIDVLSYSAVRGFESGVIRAGGHSAALLSVPVLTDHPIMPLLASEVRFFSSGFIIERTHTVCLPMTVCMELHVAEMWTVDAEDCLSLAYSKGFAKQTSLSSFGNNLPEPSVPEGLLVILRLKQFDQSEEEGEETEKDSTYDNESDFKERDDDDDDDITDDRTSNSRKNNASKTEENLRKAMMFNPLKRSLPQFCNRNTNTNKNNNEKKSNNKNYVEPQCIAFFVPTGSRAGAALGTALSSWRATLRSIGVPEHRGGGVKQNDFNFNNNNKVKYEDNVDDGSVPSGILRAFVTAIDSWSIAEDESGQGSLGFGSGDSSTGRFGLQNTVYDESIPISSDTILEAAKSLSNILGTGFLAMRYVYAYIIRYD
jgi:hypothetical protein